MKQTIITQIQKQLNALASELMRQNLWTTTPPSQQQLASCEPFCVDTLPFEQWLQWMFIPKMSEILNTPQFNGLPNRSDIYSIAEYLFEKYPQDTGKTTSIIKEIDRLLNQFVPQTTH